MSTSGEPSGRKKEGAAVHREGWLKKWNPQKKNDVARLWFVLSNGTLSWTKQPKDITPLGKIPAVWQAVKHVSGKEVVLRVKKKEGGEKELVLAADTEADTKAWGEALLSSEAAAPGWTCGWLCREKEKKPHYFVLHKRMLYWFSKEQDPSVDFRKYMSGCLKLLRYQVRERPDSATAFELLDTLKKPDGKLETLTHLLTARSAAERQMWVQALQQNKLKHERRYAMNKEHYGWLRVRKATKPLFFVLTKGRLAWYRSQQDADEKGALLLDECSFRREPNELRTVSLWPTQAGSQPALTTEGLLTLQAPDDEEFERWMLALERARDATQRKRDDRSDQLRSAASQARQKVHRSGWLVYQKRKRFVTLQSELLMWFDEEPTGDGAAKSASMGGSLRLRDSTLTRADYSFTLRTSDAKLHTFTAAHETELLDWIAAISAAVTQARATAYAQAKGHAIDPELMQLNAADLSKQGWAMQRKNKLLKRRFLDLGLGRLTVLDQQLKPKVVVPLEGCVVNALGVNAFLLQSVHQSYVFECEQEADVKQWVRNISCYIIKANAAAESFEIEKKGWLLMNGKSQWFALRKGTLYWFSQEQNADFLEPEDASKRMALSDSRVTVLQRDGRKFRFELVAAQRAGGRRLEFRTNSERELVEWTEAIGRARDKATWQAAGAPAVKTLGTPLAQLLAFERGKPDSGPVPILVRRCLLALEQPRALQTPALWQTPGSFARVRELCEALEAGRPLDLMSAAPSDVAMLLKQFLRALPEPVLVYDTYYELLEARADVLVLKELVDSQPAEHYALLQTLCDYLENVAAEAPGASAVDLAMVFAPLLLRAPAAHWADPDRDPAALPTADDSSEDVDLLKGVLVVTTLIERYVDIFDTPRLPSILDRLRLEHQADWMMARADPATRARAEQLASAGGGSAAVVAPSGRSTMSGPPARPAIPLEFKQALAQREADQVHHDTLSELDALEAELSAERASTRGTEPSLKPPGRRHARAPSYSVHNLALDLSPEPAEPTLDSLFEQLQNEKERAAQQRSFASSGSRIQTLSSSQTDVSGHSPTTDPEADLRQARSHRRAHSRLIPLDELSAGSSPAKAPTLLPRPAPPPVAGTLSRMPTVASILKDLEEGRITELDDTLPGVVAAPPSRATLATSAPTAAAPSKPAASTAPGLSLAVPAGSAPGGAVSPNSSSGTYKDRRKAHGAPELRPPPLFSSTPGPAPATDALVGPQRTTSQTSLARPLDAFGQTPFAVSAQYNSAPPGQYNSAPPVALLEADDFDPRARGPPQPAAPKLKPLPLEDVDEFDPRARPAAPASAPRASASTPTAAATPTPPAAATTPTVAATSTSTPLSPRSRPTQPLPPTPPQRPSSNFLPSNTFATASAGALPPNPFATPFLPGPPGALSFIAPPFISGSPPSGSGSSSNLAAPTGNSSSSNLAPPPSTLNRTSVQPSSSSLSNTAAAGVTRNSVSGSASAPASRPASVQAEPTSPSAGRKSPRETPLSSLRRSIDKFAQTLRKSGGNQEAAAAATAMLAQQEKDPRGSVNFDWKKPLPSPPPETSKSGSAEDVRYYGSATDDDNSSAPASPQRSPRPSPRAGVFERIDADSDEVVVHQDVPDAQAQPDLMVKKRSKKGLVLPPATSAANNSSMGSSSSASPAGSSSSLASPYQLPVAQPGDAHRPLQLAPLHSPSKAGSAASASAPLGGARRMLTVRVRTSKGEQELSVPITPSLKFRDVVESIAKSKADEYEVRSLDGTMLAGKVAAYFEETGEPPVVIMQKALVLD